MSPPTTLPDSLNRTLISDVRERSDRLMNYFLPAYFIIGLVLATFYDTWLIAFGIGGLCLLAYYSTKLFLPESDLYQYVLSAVLGIFMAQYIYQMHGLFEMHFFAFIASALLITYQKWKLQIPVTVVVLVHHAVFGYLQNTGLREIYFTQLDYFALQTFIIHILVAAVIFFICGLWAYQLKKFNNIYLLQTIQMGELQKEAQLAQERAASEKKYSELFHLSPMPMLVFDLDSLQFLDVNEATILYYGYSRKEFLNMTLRDINLAEDIAEMERSLENDRLMGKTNAVGIFRHKKKDGHIIQVDVLANFIEYKGKPAKVIIANDITERLAYINAIENQNKKLKEISWIQSHVIRAPLARIMGLAPLIRDASENRMEREKMLDYLLVSTHELDQVIGTITDKIGMVEINS
nr:PAS domain S-box protein [uncultured Mucilaginibacter sp.]